MQRSLYLLVLGHARRTDDGADRPMAIAAYQPYLRSIHPELRRSALLVARRLWDHDVKEEIESLAFSDEDIKVRSTAYSLTSSFLWYGPELASLPKNAQGSIRAPIYDGEGLKRWWLRKAEWERETYRLRTGGDLPSAWPSRQPMERDPAQLPPNVGGGRHSLGSP